MAILGAKNGREQSFMTYKSFIDTNILAYAVDRHDVTRRKKARSLLRQLRKEGAVISTQIMQEFFVVATNKLSIEPFYAKEILRKLNNFEVIIVDVGLILEAVDCMATNKVSFWDSLMIVSAERAKCKVIYTEDLNHGQIIRGVQIMNPFKS